MADEIKAIKIKLADHKGKLIDRIVQRLSQPVGCDDAADIRHDAQFLATTCLTLESSIDTAATLAKHTGEPQTVPFLNDCGMDL